MDDKKKKQKHQDPPKEKAQGNTEQEASPQEHAEEAVQEESRAEDIAALEQQVGDLNEKLLRTLAEYDNFRKRTQREKSAIYPEAVSSTIEAFLPVVDNFERAMACECSDTEFQKGMQMVLNGIYEVFGKLGVEEIDCSGLFDPNLHHAVAHVDDDNMEENQIVEVFQKGYQMGDRIIRFAMVKVAN
ncbi:nucleotide exchange factor GrpE [Candidatus Soleaferrea massiliensis]|uniref:nucleotide exchange factor GrpE n=1 Tax=Candidatus Soleaferrea massiliensis TaxID=1470354 RepID=UPI000693AA9D|nr:nucleotide exchange factor GrpE [Candidatus Soleaferrea massiliensis]